MKLLNFKRIFVVVLCACLLATTFTGCGKVDDEIPVDSIESEATPSDTTETEESDVSEETTKKPNSNKKELPWKFKFNGSMTIRDLVLDVGLDGEEVTIIQLTDLHLGECTEEDLKNPTLASTYENRQSILKNYPQNTTKVLDYADTQNPDQIVITGDCIDYLSQGSLNLMKELVWDRYRDEDGNVTKVMALNGNHELFQQMTGTVPESLTPDERYQMLEDNWEHDIYYSSKVIKDKVMLIQMHDAQGFGVAPFFWEGQAEKLSNDIAAARENGYTVLLFLHIAIQTRNAEYYNTLPLTDYSAVASMNYYNYAGCAGPTNGADKEVYDIITNNADVIAGIFCGHNHGDFYTEVKAKTADGTEKMIPQYILTASTAYGGAAIKITVK